MSSLNERLQYLSRPSQKPVNPTNTNQQPSSKLVSCRSFGSADSNGSFYDLQSYDKLDKVTENYIANDADIADNKQSNELKAKNKGTLDSNKPNNPNDTQGTHSRDNCDNDRRKSWLKKNYDKYCPSLVLKNTASVARDNLANERTFLAWLRTSLSFISIGVAITQLFRLSRATGNDERTNQYDKGGKLLGIIFMILGIVFLSFGILRYFHSQYLMTKGLFPASRGSIVIGTILTLLALAACFVVMIIAEAKS